jgi:signal transduction histidine kinase
VDLPPRDFGLLHALAQADRRFPQGRRLGLTIARDITQAHGWRLETASAPGQGSRCATWLPLGSG